MPQKNGRPDADEVEISVFGPGYGECVLVHAGHGEWIVVDSCLDTYSRDQPAMAYLREIGVDPRTGVQLVVATHWHDDHVRGLAQTLDQCKKARFICSMVLRNDEVQQVVVGRGRGTFANPPGTREIWACWQEMFSRVGPRGTPKVGWAIANRRLWSSERSGATVTALSPSDFEITRAVLALRNLLPMDNDQRVLVPEPGPNHASVALWVKVDGLSALLGADLEETGEPESGWTVIVDADDCPRGASYVKVPHHGAQSAHLDRMWTDMLTRDPVAAVTPFRKGKRSLPTDSDRGRLLQFTNKAYITSERKTKRSRRPGDIQRTINRVTRQMKTVYPRAGQVRMRAKADGSTAWTIDLLNGATQLTA